MGNVQPGWYPDPRAVNTQRFWDGEGWTDQVTPLPTSAGKAFGVFIGKAIAVIVVSIVLVVAILWVIVLIAR